MGSNFWLRATSTVGLACAMLGQVSAASAQTSGGVKAHIDIPEIARTGSGNSLPDSGDPFAGLADEFDSPGYVNPTWVDPDQRAPESFGGASGPDNVSDSFTRLIVTAPQGTASPIGFDEGVTGIPGPATLVPLSILALGFGRRRRG